MNKAQIMAVTGVTACNGTFCEDRGTQRYFIILEIRKGDDEITADLTLDLCASCAKTFRAESWQIWTSRLT